VAFHQTFVHGCRPGLEFDGFGTLVCLVHGGQLRDQLLGGLSGVDLHEPISTKELAKKNGLTKKQAKKLVAELSTVYKADEGTKPVEFESGTTTMDECLMKRHTGQTKGLVGSTQRQVAERTPESLQLQMQTGVKQQINVGPFDIESVRDGNTTLMGMHNYFVTQMAADKNGTGTFHLNGKEYFAVSGVRALQLRSTVVQKQTFEGVGAVNAHFSSVNMAKGHLHWETMRPLAVMELLPQLGYGGYGPLGTTPAMLSTPECWYAAQAATKWAGHGLDTFGDLMMMTTQKTLRKTAMDKAQEVKGDLLESGTALTNCGGVIFNLNRYGDIELTKSVYCGDVSHMDIMRSRDKSQSELFNAFENKMKLWVKKQFSNSDVQDQCLILWGSVMSFYINVVLGGGRICYDYTTPKTKRLMLDMIQSMAVENGSAIKHEDVIDGNQVYNDTKASMVVYMRRKMRLALGHMLEAYMEEFNNFPAARNVVPVLLDVTTFAHLSTLDDCRKLARLLRIAKANPTPEMNASASATVRYTSLNKIPWGKISVMEHDISYAAQIQEVKGVVDELMGDPAAYQEFINLAGDKVQPPQAKAQKTEN
jgi:hypothetical protein